MIAGAVAGLLWAAARHVEWTGYAMGSGLGRSATFVAVTGGLFLTSPVVFLLLDGVFTLRAARARIARDIAGKQRLCDGCGYDVTGMRVCSECGMALPEPDRYLGVCFFVRRPRARALRRGVAVFAAGLLLLAGALAWLLDVRTLAPAREAVNMWFGWRPAEGPVEV